jgi:hypothetical protein
LRNPFLFRVSHLPLDSVALLFGTVVLLLPPFPVAQLGGENLRGDYGMKSGSPGPPGHSEMMGSRDQQ